MPITEKQLARRADPTTIGSSDVPKILGVSQWGNELDLYLEKTGQVAPSSKTNEAMTAGHFLENGILNWAATKLGKLKRNPRRVDRKIGLVCHIDALVIAGGRPVEAKHFISRNAEGAELPDYVVVQCHAHMIVIKGDVDKCYVPHTEYGTFHMQEVHWDSNIVHYILERIKEFWDRVRTKSPPENIYPIDDDSFRRRIRKPGTQVEIDPHLFHLYAALQESSSTAEAEFKNVKREILTALDDNEEATIDGAVAFSYREQKGRKSVDYDAMQRDGVYDKYVTAGDPIRVLRRHKTDVPLLENKND